MVRKRGWSSIKTHLLEFFLIGVVFGILEDIIAIMLYGGSFVLDPKMFYIAAAVAIPFAIISELVVDWSEIFRLGKK
ncbi:hypothetical protein ACFLZZ_00745 [Nanoarchaeota archaeon]